jgi:hypothetical protein
MPPLSTEKERTMLVFHEMIHASLLSSYIIQSKSCTSSDLTLSVTEYWRAVVTEDATVFINHH